MINTDVTTTGVLEALDKAAVFFEKNPDKRTKRVFARDDEGTEVCPWDPNAVCFCALGRFAVELFPEKPEGYVGPGDVFTLAGDTILDSDDIWSRNDDTDDTAAVVELLRNAKPRK